MPRCPKGTQRNKTTGECEPKGVTEKQPRCPKGTQRKNRRSIGTNYYAVMRLILKGA